MADRLNLRRTCYSICLESSFMGCPHDSPSLPQVFTKGPMLNKPPKFTPFTLPIPSPSPTPHHVSTRSILLTSLFAVLSPTWRRKWHPAPALSPGESHGQRRLIGYSPWGHKESDMTERLHSLTHSLPLECKLPEGKAFPSVCSVLYS